MSYFAAVLVRSGLDSGDDEPRAFLSDGHAADAPPTHDSAASGDADVVEDLGIDAEALLAMCAREGTLPVDVLLAVCEKAGCGEVLEELRG